MSTPRSNMSPAKVHRRLCGEKRATFAFGARRRTIGSTEIQAEMSTKRSRVGPEHKYIVLFQHQ